MTQSAAETPNARMRVVARAGKGRFATVAADDAGVDRLPGTRAGDPWRRTLEETDRTTGEWRDEGPRLVPAPLPMAALAFRRGWLPALPLALFLPAAGVGAFEFADLWARRDQQAARAIEEGDTGRAAAVAPDHRWRGAALYRGGRYDESSEAFAGGDAADDHYNRGNALARAGDLRGALEAWGEALARDPGHEDAEHNRALVESLLEREPERQRTGDDGADGDGADSRTAAGSGKPDRAGPRDAEEAPRQAGGDGRPGGSGGGASDAGDDPSARGGGMRDGEQARPAGTPEESRDAGEKREAGVRGDGANADSAPGALDAGDRLTEEQRLAYEQWLRRIPDDPGGLLRRKFALEYRARGQQPPARSDAW